MFRIIRWAAAAVLGLLSAPGWSATTLQCVPYARIVSGVEIYGDAWTWWDQAENRYRRGHAPKKGAVLAFRPNGPMQLGHVAVVSRVLDKRRILIRHANWSTPGAIEEDVLAIDLSDAGDWSEVRVWHSLSDRMGARGNPTFGFIYPDKPKLHPFTPSPELGSSTLLARVDPARWDAVKVPAPVEKATPPAAASPRLVLALADIDSPPPVKKKARLTLDLANAAGSERSLADIIADVKRSARLR